MTFLSVTSNSLSPRLSCHYLTSTLTFSFLSLISLLVSRPLPGWYNPWFLVSFSAHLTLFFRALHYAHFHDVIMPVFISLAKVSLSSTWVSHCLCGTIICVFHSCLHSNTSKITVLFLTPAYLLSPFLFMNLTPTKSSAVANTFLLVVTYCFLASRNLLQCQITL